MQTKRHWIIAASALAMTGLVLDSSTAEAATDNDTFEVRATVVGTCTITAADLVFPNYANGSPVAETGSADFSVNCAGAAATPVAAQLKFDTGSGTFAMTESGGDSLNYGLYADSGLSDAFAEGTDKLVTISAEPQTVTVYGQIPSGQSGALGTYSQTVTATLTY